MTKRKFLRNCGLCALGLVVYGVAGTTAWAQSLRVRLRPLGDPRFYPGLRRRLAAVSVARIEQVFSLANRRAEIEVTRI